MIRINLLPYREKAKKANLARQIIVIVFSFVIFLFCILSIQAYVSITNKQLEKEIKIAEDKLAILTKKVGDVAEFKRIKADLEKKLAIINNLEENRFDTVRKMDEMAILVPVKDVWLEKISETGTNLRIDGIARNNIAVARFMKNLEKSLYIESVDLVFSKQILISDYKLQQFTLSCLMKKRGL
jgi:type IV pilus assembly protein PilN